MLFTLVSLAIAVVLILLVRRCFNRPAANQNEALGDVMLATFLQLLIAGAWIVALAIKAIAFS